MKKQKKIAGWLKGLSVLLAVMGVLFFGGLTWYIITPGKLPYEDPYHIRLLFSWFICVCCYGILFQFWKVCNEIEKDNSFSMENFNAFNNMGKFGIAMMVSYIARFIFTVVANGIQVAALLFSGAMIFVSFAFVIVCFALAQLIKNAYEMALENELTI